MTQQLLKFGKFIEEPPFPKSVQFETNTYCNANCLMCPHDKMKRSGTAKWSLISKIIREAAPKVNAMTPFLMQEPMLEPRLPAILANIKQHNRNCVTTVYSNMSILTNDTIHKIVDTALIDNLHISFYGPTEELYKKWQPPLNRETTVLNIKKLFVYREYMRRLTPKMFLHVLAVPELIEAIADYGDVTSYIDKVYKVQFDTFHGDIPDLAGNQTKYLGAPKPRVPCQRLWAGLIVHFDGSVVPCCIDYNDEHVLGNVNDKSLEDIWNDLPFSEFRRLHVEGRWDEIPMCKNCKVHEYQFTKEWTEYWLNLNTVKS